MVADRSGSEAHVVSASLVLPVGDAEAGGDFQVVEDVGSRTVAIVGDVAGNGPEAAPYAERMCREVTKRLQNVEDPAMLLEELNSSIREDVSFDRFVTACAVLIERASWSAQWAFAGHLPPHWLDSGVPIDGASPGLPLGIEARCGAISAHRRPLRPEEGMLLFTDGLEDVLGPGGDRFGSARVTHLLARELRGAEPEAIVQKLKEMACAFGAGDLADDVCLVALRVT